MVMADAYVMGSREALNSFICGDGGNNSHLRHEVHVGEVGVVVNEDSSPNIAFLGGKAAVDGDKTWGGAD